MVLLIGMPPELQLFDQHVRTTIFLHLADHQTSIKIGRANRTTRMHPGPLIYRS